MFSLIEVAQLLDYVLRLDLDVADPPEQLSAAMRRWPAASSLRLTAPLTSLARPRMLSRYSRSRTNFFRSSGLVSASLSTLRLPGVPEGAWPERVWLKVSNETEYRAWRTSHNGVKRVTQGTSVGDPFGNPYSFADVGGVHGWRRLLTELRERL